MITRYDFATPTYVQAVQLRHRVLREPLQRDINDDPLHEEHDQVHFAAWEGDLLAGTCTLRRAGTGLQMRQVAVEPSQRGGGVGRALVRACEAYAKRAGASALFCHARSVAEAFYKRCGWQPVGERFEEVGIEHVRMYYPGLGKPTPSGT